ncbi:MAG: ComEC family competence protein [candidate division WS6 bacterium OLB20]|uniref:ComEC family competence protein n=1 Tax=candidate division WS6 bacterium OLB20 TaxID=1617426 RepID=A0A136LYE9_9BACT|nr:MAG: ComEC family competence protein [candidate division WS6 bacterium OLB20]
MPMLKRLIFIIVCLALLALPLRVSLSSYLEIYFLDIGQGDAIYLRTPDGVDVLIDAGPDATVLQELGAVMPVWDREIDYVMLSHPDLDHLGGMLDVADRYTVKTFIWNSSDHDSALFKLFQTETLGSRQTLWEGDVLYFGCCVSFAVHWPDRTTYSRYSSNNASISGIVRYGSFSLFTGGDIEKDAERALVRSDLPDIDVLKVSHHGSRTSTMPDFLADTAPEVAIIQSGRDNRFGHPHQEVLNNLDIAGVQVFRTDLQGRIHLKSDGHGYSISRD